MLLDGFHGGLNPCGVTRAVGGENLELVLAPVPHWLSPTYMSSCCLQHRPDDKHPTNIPLPGEEEGWGLLRGRTRRYIPELWPAMGCYILYVSLLHSQSA